MAKFFIQRGIEYNGKIIKNDKVVSEVWFDNEDEVTAYIKSNEDHIDKKGKAKVYIRS
jgi:hypothetical protein